MLSRQPAAPKQQNQASVYLTHVPSVIYLLSTGCAGFKSKAAKAKSLAVSPSRHSLHTSPQQSTAR
ncbi:MAG: hypothetical protein EP149_00955 [Phascolarctobacterium sp.]|nr:hypothetical protein [Phascolarctobacterium sp.]